MRLTGLADWLRWQESQHPQAIALGLDRVARVWARLGPPVLPCPVLTIAGTNGKGSCVALLEAIYGAAGYVTASYSSPHLRRYNERVRLAGTPVGDAELCAAFARVEAARGAESLTYFEYGTLAALDLFVRARPEVAILEVGLGGRLDAVNLIDPDLALITNIGWDHAAWLGDSLEAIAREKAGILRPGRPAVIGQRAPPPALLACGRALGSRVRTLGRDFDYELTPTGWRWRGSDGPLLELPPPALRGRFQYDNAAAVLMAVATLAARLPVPPSALAEGLRAVSLPGRFQILSGAPIWILDVAHNGPAAAALAETLEDVPCAGTRRAVFGLLSDKEVAAVAGPLLDWVDCWYLGAAATPRARPAAELAAALRALAPAVELRVHNTLEQAIEAAHLQARPQDGLVVFGSFTTVEAALRFRHPV